MPEDNPITGSAFSRTSAALAADGLLFVAFELPLAAGLAGFGIVVSFSGMARESSRETYHPVRDLIS